MEDAGPAAQVIYELFLFPWHSNLQGMFSHHFPTNCSQLAGFFIYLFILLAASKQLQPLSLDLE